MSLSYIGLSLLCAGGDLNPHAFRHTNLNRTCLPITPPAHSYCFRSTVILVVFCFGDNFCRYWLGISANLCFSRSLQLFFRSSTAAHHAGTTEHAASFAGHLFANVVEFCATDARALYHLNLFDHWRIERENLLNAHAGENATHRKGAASFLAMLARKNEAFKYLQAKLSLLGNLLSHTHRIPRTNIESFALFHIYGRYRDCHTGRNIPLRGQIAKFVVHSSYPSWNTIESTVLRWKHVLEDYPLATA